MFKILEKEKKLRKKYKQKISGIQREGGERTRKKKKYQKRNKEDYEKNSSVEDVLLMKLNRKIMNNVIQK